MYLEQSLWSCSRASRPGRLWEALSGQWWVWVMTVMVWSGWDENEVARGCRDWPGTMLLVLE